MTASPLESWTMLLTKKKAELNFEYVPFPTISVLTVRNHVKLWQSMNHAGCHFYTFFIPPHDIKSSFPISEKELFMYCRRIALPAKLLRNAFWYASSSRIALLPSRHCRHRSRRRSHTRQSSPEIWQDEHLLWLADIQK